ncbi:MAG TPA: ubiquitin-like domain-containing protein, partial [Anaerolineales bacterium]|nr:ubiquitin-like domain-containing protein [Anaerolineales bacterium]
MKSAGVLAVALVFLLLACQPTSLPTVTILENDQITTLQTDERVLAAVLNQAGIALNPQDQILLNGLPISPDQPITTYPSTLQIRRAISLTITTPEGEKQIR